MADEKDDQQQDELSQEDKLAVLGIAPPDQAPAEAAPEIGPPAVGQTVPARESMAVTPEVQPATAEHAATTKVNLPQDKMVEQPPAPATPSKMTPEMAPTTPEALPTSILGDKVAPGAAIPPDLMHQAGKMAYKAEMPQVTATPGSSQYYEQKMQQMDYQKAHPWGSMVSEHPGVFGKILHGLAKAGNIAGDIVAPGTMALIPGTDIHNAGEEQRVEGELGQAQTRENANEGKENKLKIDQQKVDETAEKNQNDYKAKLRKLGLTLGPDGKTQNVPYEEQSPIEQAHTDLQNALADSATAKTALEHIQADPNSPQNKAILERIKVMAENAATAAGKLGLDKDKFKADYFGIDKDGNAIAGTQKDDQGNPIGPKMSAGNKASSMQKNKADLAGNVQNNIKEVTDIIDQEPGLFGKVSGRFTTLAQMQGSSDKNISKIGNALHAAAMAYNGIHGIRSYEGVKGTEEMFLNKFRNSPEATKEGLNEASRSSQDYIDDAAAAGYKLPGRNKPAPTTTHGEGGDTKATGKTVSLKAAMALPANQGKTEEQVKADITAHGHQVGQ